MQTPNEDRVYTSRRLSVDLGACLARGGEGRIHAVAGLEGLIAKRYHRPIDRTREAKLQAQLSIRPPEAACRFAWPKLLLFSEGGACCGFLMPKAHGMSLVSLHAPALLRTRVPFSENPKALRLFLLRTLYSLANGFAALEAVNVFPADVSANNFLVEAQTGTVSFIDCDSFQVTSTEGSVSYPAGASTPEYLPPELLGRNGEPLMVTRTAAHVRFSAAVIFFQTLLHGWHPYQCLGAESPVENLRAGRTALGSSMGLARGCYPREVFEIYRAGVHPALKQLFIQTLIRGHTQPSLRADFSQWKQAIMRAARELERG